MKHDIRDLIKKKLVRFTGLPKEIVEKYLAREESVPTHIDEWNFWNPQTEKEISWFYVSSRSYLFNTATHLIPKYIIEDIKINSTVLDFGGGVGNVTITLAKLKKCRVFYFDNNLIQREFIKFVAEKYNFDIKILKYNRNYEPIISEDVKVDYVFAFDVFEHIPDYPKYINLLSRVMKTKSKMYIIAPFDNKEPSHMSDNYGLDEVCKKNNLSKKEIIGKVTIFMKN